ncbi:hypothetical protein cypCar_00023829, partial [Cyprinus carpio]
LGCGKFPIGSSADRRKSKTPHYPSFCTKIDKHLYQEKCCEDVINVAKEARKRNLGPLHPTFNIVKVIRGGLYRDLPSNAHTLASGRLCISLTRVMDGQNVLVSDFSSKDELIQVLAEMCQSGYKDALRFLQENIFCDACREKHGLLAQVSGFLPLRVASYMLMPYTLPVESAYSAAQRFWEWIPEVPADVRWLAEVAGGVYRLAWKGAASETSSGAPLRRCLSEPPMVDLHMPVSNYNEHMPHSASNLDSYNWTFPDDFNTASSVDPQDSPINHRHKYLAASLPAL